MASSIDLEREFASSPRVPGAYAPAPSPVTDVPPSSLPSAPDPLADLPPSSRPAPDPAADLAPSSPSTPDAVADPAPHTALPEAEPSPAAAPITPVPPSTTAVPPPRAGRPRIAAADPGGPLLRWLMLALTGVLVVQLLRFGLRPLRRLVVLRHLRRPFWDETVHQRVSNWWQLVLVGLRDSGWRTTAGEQPRELARRTGVDGAVHCATILERARHGLGLDGTDLADMKASAETAYRASRATTSPLARALSWFRRPLT